MRYVQNGVRNVFVFLRITWHVIFICPIHKLTNKFVWAILVIPYWCYYSGIVSIFTKGVFTTFLNFQIIKKYVNRNGPLILPLCRSFVYHLPIPNKMLTEISMLSTFKKANIPINDIVVIFQFINEQVMFDGIESFAEVHIEKSHWFTARIAKIGTYFTLNC